MLRAETLDVQLVVASQATAGKKGSGSVLQRIIVPLDGTPFAEAALAPACTLARAFGSAMLAVRAYSPAGLPRTIPPDTELEIEEVDEADAYLCAVVERLRATGFTADRVLYLAEPGTAIANVAALDDADLIVMTTHPRWRTDVLDNRSTTLEVLARARVPILSWKRGSPMAGSGAQDALSAPVPFLGPESPILVPLDGSPFSETALALAQELAAAFGTYLVLARAVVGDEDVGAAERYLERVLSNLERTGVNATVEVEVGSVVSVLDAVQRRQNAGLIVMASHGLTARPTTFLGSNAAQLLEELTIPVLVVRP
jgi:nucleotide-binding universal stress UspA family protein